MKTTTKERKFEFGDASNINLDNLEEGICQAGMNLITPVVGIITAWSMCCLAGAVWNHGILNMAKGFITAILG